MDGSAELFAPIAAIPIIRALAAKDVRTEPTLRFTQAACNGAIHPALKPFSDSELCAVQETLDYWQFPKSWSLAIAEELAYRHYHTTGELLEPIVKPVEKIMTYIECITGAAGEIASVFSTSKTTAMDTFLGRRKIGKQFLTYKELPFATANAVRFMLTDLMELMVEGIHATIDDVFIQAVRDANLAGVRWLAERNLLQRFSFFTYISCQKTSLPMLKLLMELSVPLNMDECWKAAMKNSSSDYDTDTNTIALLDFLYEIAPEWTTTGIEPYIKSRIGLQWAMSKGIPLEHLAIFSSSKSSAVIEELLEIGFVPTPSEIYHKLVSHLFCKCGCVDVFIRLFLEKKLPLTPHPEKLMRTILGRGYIGASTSMVRYGMVFDRAALWTSATPNIPLSQDALTLVLKQMGDASYLPVDTSNISKGFIVDGKTYPCVLASDVLTLSDAVAAHQKQ